MAFEIPEQPYSGKIGETTVGAGSDAVKLGGEDSYPFHLFEGDMPNAPKIAMEIWDYDPSDEWPAAAAAPFKDVISAPEAWAKKCVDEYGADVIVLQLKSTDPNGMDRSADEAAAVAKKVSDAVDVPLVLWGTANNQKDEEVLKKISELCEGKNVVLGPVEEANHKGVGASALGYGHTIISSSPIDVNLAKQLNILLGNLGVTPEKIVIDPTTGGLGYGLEYSYSVMERIKMAALTQEDDKLQVPMINNVGNEVWKCKEAKESIEEGPTLGDPERRGILMESTAAVAYLLAGSDIVILRHPESVRLTRAFIDLMINGGVASDVEEISKSLELEEADLISISPEPDLDFGEAEAAPKAKPAAPKKAAAEKPKAAPKKAKKEEKKVEVKAEPEKAAKPAVDKEAEAKAKAEEEAKAKVEAEAKAKTDAEAKAKAEAEAKAKAEAKAEAEVKAKAEAEAKAKAEEAAKREAEEEAIREQRAKEQEERLSRKSSEEVEEVPMTAAKVQKTELEKMLATLNWIHKRN
ncbi:MAG: acetyl-CoA decarbonylase/synthase complex subunit delta [Desulfobacteraceae bacterium]|uniref:Acetyl-CoA decarbonylase/synthase complex subunit delta n=1 Tax=Candidatus Desulfacyla euxinica TaxID=2841693 RepID=A0A8J6MZJ0_9DELT|nr:acetyl-CoA decarbonylase/synthase complex subunit delta [Candidatus Desulfacyla euxinica]MBL6978651.1 acetyl-CoA decarbonylase/synthase complex subunit delta [Desulfobacteraceae bacterium]MBL7216562.1 acetyl-CoA decarbonylase/synthase complex subunit delta [Desulfobacteraceae bacterium]